MLSLHDIPGDQPIDSYFPGHATAGTEIEQVLFRAPFDCTVTAVQFTPNTAITGAATNYFTLTVFNRTTGAGTDDIATLAFDNGINASAVTPKTITLTSDVNLAEGDVVTAKKVVAASGLACPPGTITVHLKAR